MHSKNRGYVLQLRHLKQTEKCPTVTASVNHLYRKMEATNTQNYNNVHTCTYSYTPSAQE